MTYGHRWILRGTYNMGQRRCICSVFTIGISGISWNQLVTERKAVKAQQNKERETSTKAISSEGHC
jgi:hypothetical protein